MIVLFALYYGIVHRSAAASWLFAAFAPVLVIFVWWMADRVANIGGSWTFIIWLTFVFVIWILSNSVFLVTHPFDPYPFIFLNLILSCLAAIQAPVIMMSQNRQEVRDRLHATLDYQVNLKAELEIRHLHQKMDHLLSHQWERLVEIQEIQIELISEVRGCK